MDPEPERLDLQPGRRGLRLSAAQLGELAAELEPLVVGLRVADVEPLPPRDVLIALLPEGAPEDAAPLRLHLSASPDHPRLHLQISRAKRHRGPVAPFFRELAQALAGRALAELRQVQGDRIVRLTFRAADQPPVALYAELTGRHANLVLCGGSERAIALLVPSPAGKQAPRLEIGKPWTPPPGQAQGAEGPGLAEVLAAPPQPDEPGPAARAARAPLSWLVEWHLGGADRAVREERLRKRLSERLARRIQKARALEAGLIEKRRSGAQAERVREDAELLNAQLHLVARGAARASVPDFFGAPGAERTIELDPKRAPRENVERLFARYRKLVRASENVEQELARCRARLAALEELLGRAAAPEHDAAALEALADEAVEAGLLEREQTGDPRKQRPAEPRLPYRSFRASKGSEVRVGRGASDNDKLTFQCSKGSDLWLHTADAPGSHVVLVLAKNAAPDPDEVLDAAHLAVHFSPLRGALRADVHVAPRKQVHKPRGAPAGLVQLSGGKHMSVRLQPERLARLLAGPADR